MSSTILADRDTNLPPTNASIDTKIQEAQKPQTMEYHRQVFESRLKSGQAQQTYVSPSDNMLSPASQKLKDFKSRHGLKKSKPQTLFAKTSAKKLEAARDTPMFADLKDAAKPIDTEK
ncbi:hypothetical protein EJ05DRAFT_478117 [Pseudovirgaria hyperparasitica]|uniref:Spo12-like protein n=1 Tax=Pseudovirgaria hyperparasitica TaxID=470096 RepID=A0A6A6VZK8_9PEZI|nr:uncharacterized protein EJ05DRAFT_478117 [Pseudovirgaria hyperparasitica]KAF2756082.1 hypothetical protein EJ05DRAFT_478117 [Pseudovirgaria hyperparasitica]